MALLASLSSAAVMTVPGSSASHDLDQWLPRVGYWLETGVRSHAGM